MRLLPGILLLILCCFSRKPAVRHRFLVLFGGILYAKTRTNSNEEIHEKKNDFLDFCPLFPADAVSSDRRAEGVGREQRDHRFFQNFLYTCRSCVKRGKPGGAKRDL